MVGAGAVLVEDAQIVVEAAPGATDLLCPGLGAGITSFNNLETILYTGSPLIRLVLNTGSGSCTPGFMPIVTVTKTIANLRLGVAYGGASRLAYTWWRDSLTTRTVAVAGNVVLASSYEEPPLSEGAGILMDMAITAFNIPAFSIARFANFRFNGTLLVHGPFELTTSARKFFGPTWRWTVDLAAIGPDGAAVTGVDATYNGARTVPSSFTQTVDMFAEDGAELPLSRAVGNAVLANPWLDAQTIRPPASEWNFIFEGNLPKNPTLAAVTTWNVGTVQITSPLAVLLSTNAFVASGAVVVSGPTNTPTFTVSAAGAAVTKTLREHWRLWNTVGHALEIVGENTTATKRSAYPVDANTPDVWGWGLYAYLDVNLTVPSASTLLLRITWAVVREDNSLVTLTRDYTKTWAVSGTQRLDLLFPDDGDRPFYGERVDAIRISGFNTGVTVLNSMGLVADQDAYLKYGSRTLGDPGGVTLAQDGQFCFGQWNGDGKVDGNDNDLDGQPDRTKDHQNGIFAYALDETQVEAIDSLGGAPGQAPLITVTLLDVFTELHRLEGLTATYDDTAFAPDATDALTDSFGNTITARRAHWLRPNLPDTRIDQNVNVNLVARLVASDVDLVGGLLHAELIVFQRQRLGAVVEAQAVTAALARAGTGSTIQARVYFGGGASGGDPSIGSAATDAGGFVSIPHRTGQYLDPADAIRKEMAVYLEGI